AFTSTMTANSSPHCNRTRGPSASRSNGKRARPILTLASLAAVDPDDPAPLDRKREFALLERQRGLAEQFAAPAAQRGDVGIVVRRDLLEIVDGRDHLAGDGVALRSHAQQ